VANNSRTATTRYKKFIEMVVLFAA